MKTMTALEAKNRFGRLLDQSQREPVTVTKQGRPFSVMIAADKFDQYERALRDNLLATIGSLQDQSARAGVTEDMIADLLKDEN